MVPTTTAFIAGAVSGIFLTLLTFFFASLFFDVGRTREPGPTKHRKD